MQQHMLGALSWKTAKKEPGGQQAQHEPPFWKDDKWSPGCQQWKEAIFPSTSARARTHLEYSLVLGLPIQKGQSCTERDQ